MSVNLNSSNDLSRNRWPEENSQDSSYETTSATQSSDVSCATTTTCHPSESEVIAGERASPSLLEIVENLKIKWDPSLHREIIHELLTCCEEETNLLSALTILAYKYNLHQSKKELCLVNANMKRRGEGIQGNNINERVDNFLDKLKQCPGQYRYCIGFELLDGALSSLCYASQEAARAEVKNAFVSFARDTIIEAGNLIGSPKGGRDFIEVAKSHFLIDVLAEVMNSSDPLMLLKQSVRRTFIPDVTADHHDKFMGSEQQLLFQLIDQRMSTLSSMIIRIDRLNKAASKELNQLAEGFKELSLLNRLIKGQKAHKGQNNNPLDVLALYQQGISFATKVTDLLRTILLNSPSKNYELLTIGTANRHILEEKEPLYMEEEVQGGQLIVNNQLNDLCHLLRRLALSSLQGKQLNTIECQPIRDILESLHDEWNKGAEIFWEGIVALTKVRDLASAWRNTLLISEKFGTYINRSSDCSFDEMLHEPSERMGFVWAIKHLERLLQKEDLAPEMLLNLMAARGLSTALVDSCIPAIAKGIFPMIEGLEKEYEMLQNSQVIVVSESLSGIRLSGTSQHLLSHTENLQLALGKLSDILLAMKQLLSYGEEVDKSIEAQFQKAITEGNLNAPPRVNSQRRKQGQRKNHTKKKRRHVRKKQPPVRRSKNHQRNIPESKPLEEKNAKASEDMISGDFTEEENDRRKLEVKEPVEDIDSKLLATAESTSSDEEWDEYTVPRTQEEAEIFAKKLHERFQYMKQALRDIVEIAEKPDAELEASGYSRQELMSQICRRKDLTRLLRKHQFRKIRQKGSHQTWEGVDPNTGEVCRTTVAGHNDTDRVPKGTLNATLKQAGFKSWNA